MRFSPGSPPQRPEVLAAASPATRQSTPKTCLLSEKISVDQQEKTVSVAGPAVSDRRATEFGAPQTARPPQALAKAGVGDRHCLRIGPFFERQERNRAQTFVASFDVPVSTQLVDGRTVRSWRAFLGPFENDAQRDEAENRAIKAGFSKSRKGDKQKNSEKIVSLGLFSTKKSAQRVQAKTRFSTLRVQIREEMTQLPSTNWLKVEEPGLSIHELRMIDSTNWGENQVNVREIVCDG